MGLGRIESIWLLPVMTAFSILVTGQVALAEEAGPWRTDFAQALAEAKRLDRPLLLHFSAEWCGPCRRMEREVLNTPSVQKQIDGSFVAVRIDSDEHPELVERFEVQALPSDIFLTPDGQVLARQEGYRNRDRYLARMARIDAQFTRMQKVLVAADSPDDPQEPPDESGMPDRGRKSPATQRDRESAPWNSPGVIENRDRPLKPGGSHNEPGPPPSVRLRIQPRVESPETRAGTTPRPQESAGSPQPEPAERNRPTPQPAVPSPNIADAKPAPLQPSLDPGAADSGLGAMGGVSSRDRSSGGPSSDEQSPTAGGETVKDIPPQRSLTVGLAGYSPVALWRDRKWQKGSEEFAAVYKEVAYLMASAEEQKAFMDNPRKYAPRLKGADPVILWETDRAVPGSVRFAAYFDDKLYLFANAETRKKFKQNPLRYTRTRHVLKDSETSRH